MTKSWATIAIIASVFLLILGIIFLIAPGRSFVAIVLLGLGSVLLVVSALRLRRLAEIEPEALATGIVDLARRLDGEVTVAQVQSEFGISREMALAALERTRAAGGVQRERRGDHQVYLFKSVMPAKAVKRCPYCGTEYPIKSPVRQCTNCGATVEIIKE